jgi:hypothetical protein
MVIPKTPTQIVGVTVVLTTILAFQNIERIICTHLQNVKGQIRTDDLRHFVP